MQSGDHIGRTCVVKWFKLKPTGDDVEVSAGVSACWNQLRESGHKTAQPSQISLGVSSAVEFVLEDGKSNVLLGPGGLARGGVTSYL